MGDAVVATVKISRGDETLRRLDEPFSFAPESFSTCLQKLEKATNVALSELVDQEQEDSSFKGPNDDESDPEEDSPKRKSERQNRKTRTKRTKVVS